MDTDVVPPSRSPSSSRIFLSGADVPGSAPGNREAIRRRLEHEWQKAKVQEEADTAAGPRTPRLPNPAKNEDMFTPSWRTAKKQEKDEKKQQKKQEKKEKKSDAKGDRNRRSQAVSRSPRVSRSRPSSSVTVSRP